MLNSEVSKRQHTALRREPSRPGGAVTASRAHQGDTDLATLLVPKTSGTLVPGWGPGFP